MKMVSCQSVGNLFATITEENGCFRIVIKVLAHWCGGFLNFLDAKESNKEAALKFVEKQFSTYERKNYENRISNRKRT